MATEEEEDEQFLLVDDDRMEDVVILSEPSSDEQELLPSEYSPAVLGTLELYKTHETPGEVEVAAAAGGLAELQGSSEAEEPRGPVETACQTDDTRSYTEVIAGNVVQGTYAGGKCLADGCTSLLKSLKIGTAPGNFTGTLKEDLTHMSAHLSGIIRDFSKELTLERIKYKLFL